MKQILDGVDIEHDAIRGDIPGTFLERVFVDPRYYAGDTFDVGNAGYSIVVVSRVILRVTPEGWNRMHAQWIGDILPLCIGGFEARADGVNSSFHDSINAAVEALITYMDTNEY